jgi:long-chain acyl-CoA synthetase
MFFARAAHYGRRTRYLVRRSRGWERVSWGECARRVREIAAGLCVLGVGPGQRVALLAATRPEWLEIDFAILSVGGVTIPIYQSAVAAECGYILWHAEAHVVLAENEAQAAKVRDVAEQGIMVDGAPQRVHVQHLIVVDVVGEHEEGRLTLDALRALGREHLDRAAPELERRIQSQRADDLATIVYTSGTTGVPKGVLQTHGNHLASLKATAQLGLVREGDVDFAFLPLAHSFARMAGYLGVYAGTVTAFAQSIETFTADMGEVRPHVVPAVPRIYEKIYGRILASRESSGTVKRAIFDWALGVGRRWSACVQAGNPVPPILGGLHAIAHQLVFATIHDVLGGRVRYLISGGAPLAGEVAEFLHAVGLLVLEGYGLTETTPVLTVNRPDAFKFGTVGLPLAGVELRIAPDGEVLARGPNIARGYYKRPEETAEVWDTDGWFHTGDIGEIDADGFLRITDRKKDLIKTSGGKYIAPQKIENALKNQPHVSQVVVLGDQRKYCVALITLDGEAVREWAARRGLEGLPSEELARHEEVVALVESEIGVVNRGLASFEAIKYFRILPRDFTIEDGELTPSLKVKRKVIAERYRGLIEAMYAG